MMMILRFLWRLQNRRKARRGQAGSLLHRVVIMVVMEIVAAKMLIILDASLIAIRNTATVVVND